MMTNLFLTWILKYGLEIREQKTHTLSCTLALTFMFMGSFEDCWMEYSEVLSFVSQRYFIGSQRWTMGAEKGPSIIDHMICGLWLLKYQILRLIIVKSSVFSYFPSEWTRGRSGGQGERENQVGRGRILDWGREWREIARSKGHKNGGTET